jgi:hypothetical protein
MVDESWKESAIGNDQARRAIRFNDVDTMHRDLVECGILIRPSLQQHRYENRGDNERIRLEKSTHHWLLFSSEVALFLTCVHLRRWRRHLHFQNQARPAMIVRLRPQ